MNNEPGEHYIIRPFKSYIQIEFKNGIISQISMDRVSINLKGKK